MFRPVPILDQTHVTNLRLTQIGVMRNIRQMGTTCREVRKRRRLTLAEVAKAVGTDPSNLSRIEQGAQQPSRDIARRLFRYFEGAVSLGSIYDPEFSAKEVAK